MSPLKLLLSKTRNSGFSFLALTDFKKPLVILVFIDNLKLNKKRGGGEY